MLSVDICRTVCVCVCLRLPDCLVTVLIGSTPPRKCEDETSLAHTWDAPQGMDGPRAEADGMQIWTLEAEKIVRISSENLTI